MYTKHSGGRSQTSYSFIVGEDETILMAQTAALNSRQFGRGKHRGLRHTLVSTASSSRALKLAAAGQTRASLDRRQVAAVSRRKRDLCNYAEVSARASITLGGIDGDSTGTRRRIRARGR